MDMLSLRVIGGKIKMFVLRLHGEPLTDQFESTAFNTYRGVVTIGNSVNHSSEEFYFDNRQ